MADGSLKSLGITAEKIRKYDQRIPRYTSYPTAPFWTEEFDADWFAGHLRKNRGSSADLSLYIHIPFCQKHCLFCACNTIITSKEGIAEDYLDWLEKEIALAAGLYRPAGKTVQLHFGGGTPNYLTHRQMDRVVKVLRDTFDFHPRAEASIEVDPRLATPEDVRRLYSENDFRRISFGTQDFYDATQSAIGREQTRAATFANVDAAREAGFQSVNIDLIYGLPRQTEDSWRDTMKTVTELRPDRIALYNFAYLPTKLAHQRTLDEELLPSPETKLRMFIESHDRLTGAGYVFIGMDHYALADDPLARALEDGTLRRNFMGYTTLRGVNMLSFGTSSISDLHGAFAQNDKKLSVYKRMIGEGRLPTERGLVLSEDDMRRRFIIEEIMCNGRLRFDAREGIESIVKEETPRLELLAGDGLIELGGDGLRVTPKGRIFLRNIAVVFDAYIKHGGKKPLFSRSV